MTNRLPPLSTQIVAPGPTTLPLHPPLPSIGPPSSTQDATKQEAVEEEPYTIKCICNFSDDDGNTIYCETCDTWQHIECFYPDNVEDALREDFSHSCADCKPRTLDRQKAHERQSARLNMPLLEETTDKKAKRPPSKSHKRKPKPTDLHLNGQSPTNEHPKNQPVAHDHPPAKKSKISHKSSHSVSSQAPKKSPPLVATTANRINHGHPPSPATTPPDLPNDESNNYSNILHLCDDQGVQIVQSNSFVRLEVSNAMSVWLRDPDRMRQETGLKYSDVYQKLPKSINSLKRNLHVGHKPVSLPSDGATTVRWQFLTAPAAIEKDVPLMELNGQVGFQKDYCADAGNRWEDFSSPLPFVFFHPMLPLYIDTRKEGSRARYVRRSCKPNALLDTYLSEGSEYHFWLVSDRSIAAKEQITIPWDFRFPPKDKPRMLRALGLGDEETGTQGEPDINEEEYQSIAGWVRLVLSEYGGCACDLRQDCAFARFRRKYHGGAHSRPNGSSNKKKRKPKVQHTISPTSTGHATNSRAASEGHLDDATDVEARSQSGSSRSKPPSRDMTPARQGSFDTLGILTEPTDRDKRKVAMVEDSFRRMEQQQPPRKKKRVPEGSTTPKPKPTSRASTAAPNPNSSNGGDADRRYVDAGTSRSKSNSPVSAMHSPSLDMPPTIRQGSVVGNNSRAPSVALRSNYCDAAVQTDPVQGQWYSGGTHPTPSPKRRVVSLSKRLLANRYRSRQGEDGEPRGRDPLTTDVPIKVTDTDAPPTPNQSDHNKLPQLPTSSQLPSSSRDADKPPADPSSAGAGEPNDIVMPDAPSESSRDQKLPALVTRDAVATRIRSPDLRVQMPPVPMFGSPTSAVSVTNTPFSAGSSMVQSPSGIGGLTSPSGAPSVNGTAATPGPVKKKMSLSDYRSRMNKAQAARPSGGATVLKPSMSNADESSKPAAGRDTAGSKDVPTAEKRVDAGRGD